MNYLFQNIHPKIKFTKEHDFKEILFLNILIKIKMAKLSGIYHEPTNT